MDETKVNIFSIIALGVIVTSSGVDAGGVDPAMRDPKLPAIESVTIRETAAHPPFAGESNDQCGQFVLTKDEVARYLRTAREVTRTDYLHMLDWSPCYASGDVVFADGVTGVWGIQQLRAGSLKLSNGRAIYLYCPQCRARGFERP